MTARWPEASPLVTVDPLELAVKKFLLCLVSVLCAGVGGCEATLREHATMLL